MKHKTMEVRGHAVLLDKEDYERFSGYSWHIGGSKNGMYVLRKTLSEGKRVTSYLHREIMGLAKGDKMIVDHKNHDTFDNRKSNLRVCTRSQNQHNMSVRAGTSVYKGVSRYNLSEKKPWQCHIRHDGRDIHVGLYVTERLAALAYNRRAVELFGEYALLNKIEK